MHGVHAMHSVDIPRSVGYRKQDDTDLSVVCGTMVFTMTILFFDQFDSQVGVIGILAGPAGVREVGWRLRPEGASTEPDEMVQRPSGSCVSTSPGSGENCAAARPTSDGAVSEAVLQALGTVGYGRRSPTANCQAERHWGAGACHRGDHGG